MELVQAGLDVQIYERSDRVFADRGDSIVMRPGWYCASGIGATD